MHIAHIQGIFSPEHGGPTHSLANYCRGQVKVGHRVSVWALEGYAHTSPALRLESPVESHIFQAAFPTVLGRSRQLRAALQQVSSPDVLHLHGAWLRAMHYGAELARVRRIPFLLEVMGMYEPYSLGQKWFRKRIARWWFQDAILRDAACLHVNSRMEAANLRQLGFCSPMAIIPVGVEMPELGQGVLSDAAALDSHHIVDRPFALFLSRIHHKKGVELLLRAWVGVSRRHPDVSLVIAGAGNPDYVAGCRRLAEDLKIGKTCIWTGSVSDTQKKWLLANARLFVLPTFSENYGNVVAEALAHATPVVTTNATPWRDIAARGCGWVIDPDAASVESALTEALALRASELRRMGVLGRRWAAESFSLERVLADLEGVYSWLRAGGAKPGCVE
ncbi:MAG TPA: glycosyltransferase [Verrucomicrobiota bacterium]|nr:glycosyltransferase [Verrucomicrobiota bacterium]